MDLLPSLSPVLITFSSSTHSRALFFEFFLLYKYFLENCIYCKISNTKEMIIIPKSLLSLQNIMDHTCNCLFNKLIHFVHA
jgi:hypothetical protein